MYVVQPSYTIINHLLKTYNADEETNSFSTAKLCKNFAVKAELERGPSEDFLESHS